MLRFFSGFLLAAAVANAQFIIPATVPIDGPIPGAHGSLWDVQLHVYNGSNLPARIGVCNDPLGFPQPHVAPGATSRVTASTSIDGRPLIRCILGTDEPEKVKLSLRVQDLSRQSQTWGTEIPLIKHSDLIASETALVNVPVLENFRQALRIYTWDGSREWPFVLEILSQDGRILVAETLLVPPSSDVRHFPGFAQILDLPVAYPTLAGEEAVTVRILPQMEGALFWAFVSVTNNETQHVTTITPQ
jgi:hypothetical protein